jgi:quercetin dioxygenase-like cupin family protein
MATIKDWGLTDLIFSNSIVEIHKLSINKSGYSSKHYHAYKYNVFYVDQGSVEIIIWLDQIEQKHILNDGDSITIKPNIWHKFIALKDTTATEIYYTSIDSNDIIRENNS